MPFLRPSIVAAVVSIGSSAVVGEEGTPPLPVPAPLAEAIQTTVDASVATREASLQLLHATHQLFSQIEQYLPNAEPWERHLIAAIIAPRGFLAAHPEALGEGESIFADGGTHTILGEGVDLPILGDGTGVPYRILADGGWVDFSGDSYRILADGGWVDVQAILADGGWVDFMKYLTAALEQQIQRMQEGSAHVPVIQGITAEDDWETPAHE